MAIIFSANFDVGTTTDLAAYTPQVGTSFTQVVAPAGIVLEAKATSNNCGPSASVTDLKILYVANPAPASADYNVKCSVPDPSTVVSRRAGIFGRVVDENNCYFVITSNALLVLGKLVTGAYTELASHSYTPAAGDTIELDMVGTTIRMLLNTVQVGSVTDSSLTAIGKAGIGGGAFIVSTHDWSNINLRFDDFVVTVPDAGAIYAQTAYRFDQDDGNVL